MSLAGSSCWRSTWQLRRPPCLPNTVAAARHAVKAIGELHNSVIEADGYAAAGSCIAALLASPKAAVVAAVSSKRDWTPAA